MPTSPHFNPDDFLVNPPPIPVTPEMLNRKLDRLLFMVGKVIERDTRIETRLVRLLTHSGLTPEGDPVTANAIDLGDFKPGAELPFPPLNQEIPA